ncbi:hypothetical protein Celaphus_00005417, partial [Cervus elaphus hippelaphus]
HFVQLCSDPAGELPRAGQVGVHHPRLPEQHARAGGVWSVRHTGGLLCGSAALLLQHPAPCPGGWAPRCVLLCPRLPPSKSEIPLPALQGPLGQH